MTTQPLPDTWHTREYPVLREVVRLTDQRLGDPIRTRELAELLDLSHDDVQRAGLALAAAGLVETIGDFDTRASDIWKPSAEARRLVGTWPSAETALDRMIAALEAIAEHTDNDDTRTRARKALDALTGAGRQIGVGVAAAAITGQIPT